MNYYLKGWQELDKLTTSNASAIPLKNGNQNPQTNWCTPDSCLEEVIDINGVCCMDVLITHQF